MLKKTLAILIITAAVPSVSYAECIGNVYSMNAGRGHTGFIMDLQDDQKITTTYNGDRALKASKTLFSGSAMAYDVNTNRTYYVSSPRPKSYYVQDVENDVSEDQFERLDFHANRIHKNQLAYYSHDTGENVLVGEIDQNVYRMVYDPTQNRLIASDHIKVFTINPINGNVNIKGKFNKGMRSGGFTSWGDFLLYKGNLLFVTNNRSYTLDISTDPIGHEVFGFHSTDFITAATLDQNGQVLIAAKNHNVNGNVNSTWLWRVKLETGEKKRVGLMPTKISAMTTNTQELHECYEPTVFKDEEPGPGIEVEGGEANEGEDAVFTITFDPVLEEARDINLALEDVTAIHASGSYDYFASLGEINLGTETIPTGSEITRQKRVSLPAGTESITVSIPIRDDHFYEVPFETFNLAAWFDAERADISKASMTIIDDENEYAGLCGENFTPGAIFTSQVPGEDRGDIRVRLDCETGVLSLIDDYGVQGNRISGAIYWDLLDEYNVEEYRAGVRQYVSVIDTPYDRQADSMEYATPVGLIDAIGPEQVKNVYKIYSNIRFYKPGTYSCGEVFTDFNVTIDFNPVTPGPLTCRIDVSETYCDGVSLQFVNHRNTTCR